MDERFSGTEAAPRAGRTRLWNRVVRPLALSAIAGVLVAAMLATTPASAANTSSASAKKAAATSKVVPGAKGATSLSPNPGVRGGSGSGKAVGRSTVARLAKPPVATPAQKRLQKLGAAKRLLTPKQRQGTSPPAFPTNAPQAPGRSLPAPSRTAASASPAPKAPNDFNYFRASDVTGATGGSADDTDEPSVANDGSNVLYTGNWYAALSNDSGNSFSYVNPYSLGPAPTLPNGGFCCDQVAIHSPSSHDVTAWGLLYCNVTDCPNSVGDNLIRLAIARNQSDLGTGTFDYYDFSAQSFGFPEGDWIDYPHFGLGANSLYLSLNVFNGLNFVNSIMVRYDLSSFANGSWSANWAYLTSPADFTWTPVDTSHDTFGYWAATKSGDGTTIRVYNWQEGTDFSGVHWNDFAVSFNSETKNGSCAAPDGNNWCAFNDSRVKTGGEVGVSTVYFMWDAAQGGGFAYPYTEWASFDVHTGPATSIAPHQVFNNSLAWQYPGLGVDAAGNLGVSIQFGGGGNYPGSQFLLADDVTGTPPYSGFTAFGLDNGSHASTRWGDFLTARPATTPGASGNSWIVTGFTLHDDGFGNPVTTPHFYWVGRQRDDPFTPSAATGLGNTFTEGSGSSVYTGYFNGPSNCACDYVASNGWGDGNTTSASVVPWFTGYFLLSGFHTYGEEGSYTTSLTTSDFFGHSAFATGSSTVNDAPLTAQATTLNGRAGTLLSGVVANFTDADPFGTISDYSATIYWGDSTSSAGTIGSGFTVSGSHTYANSGNYTVTVYIFDVGGAVAGANSTAHVIPPVPTLTSVTPNSGTTAGGTNVTIIGTKFTGATAVKFGSTPATSFTVVTDTKITAKTPARTGTVDVRVTTGGGTTAISNADHYKFVAPK